MVARLPAALTLYALLAALAMGSVPARAADTASIFDTVAGMKDHTVVEAAIREAREIATLKADGAYTLFAPTDAAFKKLDDAAIKTIATDKAAVKRLIRGHVVLGKLTSAELKKLDGKELRTLQGTVLKVQSMQDGIHVGAAKIATANIECSNGVIHVIDAVLPIAKE
jgi:uncharacterized surface protein with fasciclin (FAS1) repeats